MILWKNFHSALRKACHSLVDECNSLFIDVLGKIQGKLTAAVLILAQTESDEEFKGLDSQSRAALKKLLMHEKTGIERLKNNVEKELVSSLPYVLPLGSETQN